MKDSPWLIPTSIWGIIWPLPAKRHFYTFATFILIMIYLDLKAQFSFPSLCTSSDSLVLVSRIRLPQHQQHKPKNLSNVLPHIVSFVSYFFRPPLDRSFSGYLGFWHQVRVISGHFDTRQCKEASVMTKIIASLTMILSQMPKPLHHCSSVIAQFYSSESKTVDEE